MKDLNILESGYFGCKYDRSDLPLHDSYKDIYECGSNTLNVAYYIWMGLLMVTLVAALMLSHYSESLDINIISSYCCKGSVSETMISLHQWFNVATYVISGDDDNSIEEDDAKSKLRTMPYFKRYLEIHRMMRSMTFSLTTFITFLLLPVYVGLAVSHRTHTYEYAWIVSLIYLSGETAFIVAMTVLVLFVVAQVLIYAFVSRGMSSPTAADGPVSKHLANEKLSVVCNSSSERDDKGDKGDKGVCGSRHGQAHNEGGVIDGRRTGKRIWGVYVIYTLINLIVVGGVNVAYVVIALNESRSVVVLCQVLFSIFKLIWNGIISPKLVLWIVYYLSISSLKAQQTLFVLQFVVSIFTNIVIPCLMVTIISPNCLYNIFHQESVVTSTYLYTECTINIDSICTKLTTYNSSTSYRPPFTYSYQCSSTFITYYAPVFVGVCILSTFIVPLMELCVIQLRGSSRSSAVQMITRLKQPTPISSSPSPSSSSAESPSPSSDQHPSPQSSPSGSSSSSSSGSSSLIGIDEVFQQLVFDMTLVGLIITFGTIFPPLAIAFLVTLCRRSYYTQVILGRFVLHALKTKVDGQLDALEDSLRVQPLLTTMHCCAWILLYTCCSFYALFLFDILGDRVGFYGAYWVLIVMPCVPLCIHAPYLLSSKVKMMEMMMMGRSKIARKDQEHSMDGTGAGDGVELSPSISSPSSSFVSHQQSYFITHMHLTASSSSSSTLSSVINPLSFGSHNSSTSSSIYSSSSGYGSSMHDFDVADRTDSRAGHWRTA
jgi:hypothetical protein